MPSRKKFAYTFDNLANIIGKFLNQLGVDKFFMYVFDYGAPIGFRIAIKNPQKILDIISQNGNVYAEGLGKKWTARAEYWKNPTPELREQYKSAFAPETIINQYIFGTPEGSVAPNGYSLDIFYTQRPDYAEIKKDLPAAQINFVDSGYFVLESHCKEIATLIKKFFRGELT